MSIKPILNIPHIDSPHHSWKQFNKYDFKGYMYVNYDNYT
jgi:hypothetical protein